MPVGALTGIRVLDFGQYIAGSFAAMLLAEQGADVIKIEKPGGDPFRAEDGFLNWNRSKKAITLDLKQPAGLKIALDLAKQADVIIENFRPGIMGRLGVSYETVKSLNPRMVYCSISGFGTEGPYSDLPGYEQLVSSLGTVYAEQGYAGKPLYVVLPLASIYSAVEAAFCIVTALFTRETTGAGQRIDLSMFRTILSTMRQYIYDYEDMPDKSWGPGGKTSCYRAYKGADGKWFFLALGNHRFFKQFALMMGHEEWLNDPLFEGAPWLISALGNVQIFTKFERIFASRPAHDWIDFLQSNGIPCAMIVSVEDFMTSEQVRISGLAKLIKQPGMGMVKEMGIPVNLDMTPGSISGPAPSRGQHTTKILRSLGYRAADIRKLKKEKVIR